MTEEKKIDRLFVDKKDIDDFNRLKEKDSPFAGCQNKDIFLAAMVVGFNEGSKIELKSKEGYVREEYLTEEDRTLIKSIAIAEDKDLKVLADKQKVFLIAEQYATGGIVLLKAKVFGVEQYGSYAKKLKSELLRECEKLRKKLPQKPLVPEELDGLSINDLTEKGESDAVEFKSSFIWDFNNKQPSKEMKIAVVKTISSFMNTSGGFLLIGVGDEKKIIGLDKDLAQTHHSLDEFERTFTNAINNYIGKVNAPLTSIRFDKVKDKDIAIIRVKPSPHPVYLKCEDKKEEFYIRSGNSSQPLDISDATQYIKEHWPDLR